MAEAWDVVRTARRKSADVMRAVTTAAGLALLSGCMTTASVHEVQTQPSIVAYTTGHGMQRVSSCLLRALDEANYPLGARHFNAQREEPGRMLVVQQNVNGQVMLVVELRLVADGTRIRAHMSPDSAGTYGLCCRGGYQEAYIKVVNRCQ
ncbi:MAG: hypothetical protein A3H27_17580 [Acidobacteria bacterium RIFCSPLOWO2_02_FULL_59_13]|nr:MAG: hypothetical protein A3H27_17580 [Acidobacteria bacterium RIFCSPLOWO2_02_FULL_59_13]